MRLSNMKIRQCFGVTIILLGFAAKVLGVRFQYYEHDDLDFQRDISLSGSHAIIGDFPHWCLGNIQKCMDGFSIKTSIKMLHKNVDTSEVFIFSNGGGSFSSEGFYLFKKLGDQYEAGVTKSNQKWRVNFRLIPDQLVNFLMTWNETSGLRVYVDELEYKQDLPESYEYDGDLFDTYSHFLIGNNMYGEPLQENLFEIEEIEFYDKIIDNKMGKAVNRLGCVDNIPANAMVLPLKSSDTSNMVQQCRLMCSQSFDARITLLRDSMCYCANINDLDILTTSHSTCNGDQLNAYRSTFLTKRNPYTIDVKVHRQSNRLYVKPLESVRIEILSNLPHFVSFSVDMGDGIKITTFEREVYHYWYQAGNFSIVITAKLGSIDVSGNKTFLVEDVDEGIAPEMVHIAGFHATHNQKGMFDIYFASNFSTVCTVDFGDTTTKVEVRSGSGNMFVSLHRLEHSFRLIGHYNPSVTCQNNYGDKTSNTMFTSKTFDILFDYVTIDNEFRTQYAQGFPYLDTSDISRNTKDSLPFKDNNGLISFPLQRPFENLLSFNIGDESVQKRIFYVQSNLTEAEIRIDNLADAWMLTTNITVIIPPGYQTFVNCTFGLSVDEMFYVYASDYAVVVEFLFNYTSIGYYDVVVNTFNDISETSISDLISVEVPIDTIEITTSNIIDKTDPVVLSISLNMDNDGPQKVRFDIDHGDGHIRTHHYFSSTKLFTSYQNSHIYADWGMYRICVTAMNEISNITACTRVQVGQNMTYNDIQTDTDARVSTSNYASVILTSTSGSDRTYIVNFGDGHPFTFTDRELDEGEVVSHDSIIDDGNTTHEESPLQRNASNALSTTGNVLLMTTEPTSRSQQSTGDHMPKSIANRTSDETIEVYHIYERPGQYRVSMTVQNEFSEQTKDLCPTIIVDDTDVENCEKPDVWFDGIDISQPYERIRSKQIDIIVNASSSCSDVFMYSWKMTRLLNGYYKTFSSICETDGSNGILTIPEVFLGFGNYKITITVAPVGYPLAATSKVINLKIIPSPPVAYIAGDDEMWFLTFGTTTIDFQQSRDPDLILNKRKGIEYDLFCMPENAFSTIEDDDLNTLRGKSMYIIEDTLFGGKTKNPARFYDYATCLDPESLTNATADISLSGGLFNMPSRFFSSEFPKKTFVLYVTKDGRTTKAHRTIELRVSNSTDAFSELDALLAKKDVAGVLAAVNILSSGVDGGSNSTAAQEEAEQMKEALVNYVEAVSDKVQNVGQCKMAASAVTSLTEGEISMKTRSKGCGAIAKTSASMSSKFADEPMSTLTNVAEVGLKGISNVLPKQTEEKNEKTTKRTKRQLEKENLDVKVDHCKVETEVPQKETDETEVEEELDDYNSLIKRNDLLDSDELVFFYNCLYSFPKAFRGAVRKYGKIMWFPMSILDVENDDIFSKYAVEWEPFDVDEFINDYCRLEKRRLDRERLEADESVAMASMNAIGDVSNLMLGKMEATRRRRKRREAIGNGTIIPDPDEEEDEGEDVDQSLTIEADNVAVQMQNIDPDADGEQAMGTDAGGAKLDSSLFGTMGAEDGCSVGATVTVNQDNPFTFGNGTDSKVGTRVVSIDLSNPCTGQKALVQNTTKPIVVEMDGNPDKIDCPMEFILCLSRKTSGEDPREYNYHPVLVETNDSTIHFTIWPDREGDRFQVFIKYEDYPNATWYDHTAIIPHDSDAFSHINANDYPEKRRYLQHTYFPPQHLTKLNGTYRIAIKLYEKTNVNFDETKVCLNYSTQLMISGCKFWNEEEQMYKSDGLLVSNDTTIWKTICLSTHLTSFGGDFAVPPNTIDFSNVWAKFDPVSNPAVFSTVIALIGIYVILVIWARRMDKKDLLKWGATPLEDNLPTDNYHYQITVQTGMRKKAGTTSKISFVLSGESNDSGARRLYDGHRKTLNEGSILNYILSVEQCLGPLSFLRIWHDNSGKGKWKSWFLDQIQISDLQTGERYFFLCDRWLAVEEGDGMIDRIIPVAGREDLAAFKHLFTSSIRKKLTSDHLWFSVFSRPTRSSFTRVQRISCCMSLLFMTMITNAMWFKSDEREGQTNALQIGPVSFTLQQVFVSFASTMLVFPVNFIIITFFRRCRPKKNAVVQMHQQAPKKGKWKNVTSSSQIWGNAPKRSKWRKFTDALNNITNFHQKSKYGADDIDPDEEDKPKPKIVGLPEEKQAKKKKKPGTFPHWCIYIAYVLTVLSIIVPGFFTILYSMEWGPEKANEWLTTFLMSFFQSVIVVQPIKVMCLVAFIACVLKKPDIDEEDGASEDINNVIAAHDEEMLNKGHEELDAIVEKRKRANEECQPIDMETLNKTREARMMEIKMETVVREIAIYLLFVLILFFLSYQQRDSFSFRMASNLKNLYDNGFSSITTTEQYWKWVEAKLIPAMYATHYDNGTEIKKWWDKRCTADLASRRVGIPRLRQLRVKPDTCTVNKRLKTLINHCRDEYGWTDDDAKDYFPGWKKPDDESNYTSSMLEGVKSPWIYQNSFELANAPYVGTISTYKGGGYVAQFKLNVDRTKEMIADLRKNIWIDIHTRGLFLEFTVYNPNVNLFGSMTMLVEFMQSGGAVTRTEFKVFRLLSYIGGMGILVIIFEVLYSCFTLYFFVRFVKKLKKEGKKYFKSFWNKLEFVLMVFCVTVIAMYALKHILTSVAMDALKDRERAGNVNFNSLAQYDELYSYMVGIVVFLATIQFLKLLQFNKKMNMLGDTVSLAAKDLKVFSFAFIVYFLAFTMFGFLLFGTTLYPFSGFITAAESMFAFTLGSFDFAAMEASQKILGPIFFFLFIFIVYVGLMSIFLTIIADAFNTVKENVATQTNDYEIVDFIWKKIKGVIG